MAVSQADIDALNTAIASGERQVTLGGQSITYRSVGELVIARNDLQNQMNIASAATAQIAPRSRRMRLYHGGRGFNNGGWPWG